MKPILIALLLSFLLPFATFADETVTIGQTAIQVPLPAGFARFDGVNADVDKLMNSLVPPTNRMLLIVATPDDVKAAKAGTPGNMKRYMLVQTFKDGEAQTVTVKQFAEVLTALETQFATKDKGAGNLESEVNNLLKGAKLPTDLKIGETSMLGVFEKNERAIDIGMLSKVQIGQEAPSPLAAAASIMLVHGKVSYLYVYSEYHDTEDVAWARRTVKAWREAILAANPE